MYNVLFIDSQRRNRRNNSSRAELDRQRATIKSNSNTTAGGRSARNASNICWHATCISGGDKCADKRISSDGGRDLRWSGFILGVCKSAISVAHRRNENNGSCHGRRRRHTGRDEDFPFRGGWSVRASRYLPVSPIMIYLNRYAYDISAIREADEMRGQSFLSSETHQETELPSYDRLLSLLLQHDVTQALRQASDRLAAPSSFR